MSSDRSCDNRYFNVKMINTKPGALGVKAIFQSSLTTPIIDNPSEYYVSIIKFSIPGGNIPVFYAETDLKFPNNNIDQTVWTVTIKNPVTNLFVTKHIMYVNQGPEPPPSFTTLPTLSLNGTVPRTDYFFIYSYQQVLNMFNTAMANALTDLIALDPTLVGYQPPYFIYREGIISLIVPSQWLTTSKPDLYFNKPTYDLFNGLNGNYFAGADDLTFKVRIEYKDNYYQPPFVPIAVPPADYLIFTEEYQVYRNWSPLRSILFVSNSLTTAGESYPNFENITNVIDPTGNISYESILTDFTPDIVLPGTEREQLVFTQTGPFRLVDLTSHNPVSRIDMFIYWTDIYGHRYPITIPFNSTVEVKLLFSKKELYRSLAVGKK